MNFVFLQLWSRTRYKYKERKKNRIVLKNRIHPANLFFYLSFSLYVSNICLNFNSIQCYVDVHDHVDDDAIHSFVEVNLM